MVRTIRTIKLDGGREKICVRIETVLCEANSQIGRERKQHLFRAFAEDPTLLMHGDIDFVSMRMAHNGERWVVETELIVERK